MFEDKALVLKFRVNFTSHSQPTASQIQNPVRVRTKLQCVYQIFVSIERLTKKAKVCSKGSSYIAFCIYISSGPYISVCPECTPNQAPETSDNLEKLGHSGTQHRFAQAQFRSIFLMWDC